MPDLPIPPHEPGRGEPIDAGHFDPPAASLPPVDGRARAMIGFYVALAVALSILHLLVEEKAGPLARIARPIVEHALLAGALIAAVIAVTITLNVFVIDRLASAAARYNLRRVAILARTVTIGVIALSMLFATWYTAVLSLGLVSLILGFALQTPITSFIGWIYILVKSPYRVGDRIRLGDAAGDVIDVSFLDTTLWEIGGPFVSTDDPSGRVIRLPNSLALNSAVYNYSMTGFPYVWNEVKVLIGYGSDLELVASTMNASAAAQITPEMRERIPEFRRVVARTPIDARPLHDKPSVIFRSHESSWLEATVRYLVEPREATTVKARITSEVLIALGQASDRVLLPRGAER
jgi:small-conductance mechanosensitive channel